MRRCVRWGIWFGHPVALFGMCQAIVLAGLLMGPRVYDNTRVVMCEVLGIFAGSAALGTIWWVARARLGKQVKPPWWWIAFWGCFIVATVVVIAVLEFTGMFDLWALSSEPE